MKYDPYPTLEKWKETRNAEAFYDNVTRAELEEFMGYIENVFENMNFKRFEEMVNTINQYEKTGY